MKEGTASGKRRETSRQDTSEIVYMCYEDIGTATFDFIRLKELGDFS